MVQTPIKPLTLEGFLALPATKPASEYITGQVKPSKMARAFTELRCTFGGRSTVPDLSVFLWENIPRKENGGVENIFSIAPDWTIEILSPDQSQNKVIKNILHCLQHGTQMGWLIDPSDRSVFVYGLDRTTVVCEQPNTKLPMPEFAAGFNLTVIELFDWLLE
jgi:Uma2 family endonuclease